MANARAGLAGAALARYIRYVRRTSRGIPEMDAIVDDASKKPPAKMRREDESVTRKKRIKSNDSIQIASS